MQSVHSAICSRCHANFKIANVQKLAIYWEAVFEGISAEFPQHCPICITQAIDTHITATIKATGLQPMLELAQAQPQSAKLVEYIDYTIENRNYVFSQWYHLKRGECCHNGCRHCPYTK